MKIKTKTLVLATVGALALSYAVLGSNAFADSTNTVPTVTIPVAAPTPPADGRTPVPPPIQAPADLSSPSAGISQGDENGDVNEQSDDANESGDNEVGDSEDGISGDESGTVALSDNQGDSGTND